MKPWMIAVKLWSLSLAAQGFWAGGEGVGRGRGPRLAEAPISGPTAKDIELDVEEGKILEIGYR